MDVDLLRPGTVPISPDTVLWFEFLLDKDLLLKHLQKPSADPTPVELIVRFYDAILETLRNRPECENNEGIIIEPTVEAEAKHPAKNIALKCLSLKVAAFLKWNIDDIRLLPFKTQISLLQDLLYFTNERKFVEIPNLPECDISEVPKPFVFALLIYHRWLLSITMHRINTNLQHRTINCEIYPNEESIICTPENVEKTIKFLTEALKWEEIPNMLTFDCIKLPSEEEDSTDIDWSLSEVISKAELNSQVSYELGTFFFYKENYSLAKKHFSDCTDGLKLLKRTSGFVKIDNDLAETYMRVCDGSEQSGSLLDQLNYSVFNHYVGLTNILMQDNVKREVPLMHRINLELDIQGALSSGTFTVAKDFLFKVRALNFVRCILDKSDIFTRTSISPKDVNNLIWAIQSSWKNFPAEDKNCLKNFLLELILKSDVLNIYPLIQSNEVLHNIFDKSDIAYIEKSKMSPLELPDSLNKTNWTIYDTNKKEKPKLELRQLEQQLITTFDYKVIRELLVKIALLNAGTNVWKMNPQWELPIPLQSVLKSLQRGFIQDFAFVLLVKSREQMQNKNWNSSLELLIVLDKEIQESQSSNLSKLSRLISWEILLVQITQLLEDWPKNTIDKEALANACEVCLQSNESVIPRTEIVEQCVMCLLNLGRWEFLINLEKRWPFMEISSGIALACHELMKHKGNKKLPKSLWDAILPIFLTQSKRSSAGSCLYQDSQLSGLKNTIMLIFSKLRNSVALSIVISLLTRLQNVLKDEASQELQLDCILLWPAVVSNANSYNIKAVGETLTQVVMQALVYYPTDASWLRLLGDINFLNGHYRSALNYYLKSLLICNDYFNIPVRNDDHVFRRMIKCCMSLGCYTQAAVLCQFLEEPDYVLAFRILGDQKTCNDAVDAYYHCFWDINILEFLIHNHHKKGEYQRRKSAVQVIGLLELNASNNEEIQREASNLRKSTFLRALCKQYVFS